MEAYEWNLNGHHEDFVLRDGGGSVLDIIHDHRAGAWRKCQRADTTVSQPEVATEVILNWLDATGRRVPNRTSSANYGRSS